MYSSGKLCSSGLNPAKAGKLVLSPACFLFSSGVRESSALVILLPSAGLPALLDSQSGQVRKEAATVVDASAGVRLAIFLSAVPRLLALR